MIGTIDDFKTWLRNTKSFSKEECEQTESCIKVANDYAIENGISTTGLVNCESKQAKNTALLLLNSEMFVRYSNNVDSFLIKSVKLFLLFLELNKEIAQVGMFFTEDRTDKLVTENRASNTVLENNNDKFNQWLKSKELSVSVSDLFKAYEIIDGFFKTTGDLKESVLQINRIARLKKIAIFIEYNPRFRKYCGGDKTLFVYAMELYIEYVESGRNTRFDYSSIETKLDDYNSRATGSFHQQTKKHKDAFTKHEAVVLLESYMRIISGELSRNEAIRVCSYSLRSMALNHGKSINNKYRNENRVALQMASMESAYRGRTVLTPAIDLYNEIVQLYRTNNNEYIKLLTEAEFLINKSEKNKALFCDWISKRMTPEYLSDLSLAFHYIELQGQKERLINNSLFESFDSKKFKELKSYFQEDIAFKVQHEPQMTAIETVLEYLIEFTRKTNKEEKVESVVLDDTVLKEKKTFRIAREKHSNNDNTIDANPKDLPGAVDQESDFLQWMKKDQKISESSCRLYISSLRRAEKYAHEWELESEKLFGVTIDEVQRTIDALYSDVRFKGLSRSYLNCFRTAQKKLIAYLGGEKTTLGKTNSNTKPIGLSNKMRLADEYKNGLQKYAPLCLIHREEALQGDFSFLRRMGTNEEVEQLIKKCKKAYYDLGPEIVKTIFMDLESLKWLFVLLNNEKKRNETKLLMDNIHAELNCFSQQRLNNRIGGFVHAYTSNERIVDKLLNWLDLNQLCYFKDIYNGKTIEVEYYIIAVDFLKWCKFDLEEEIDSFLGTLYTNIRERFVVEQRAMGWTLNRIGEELNVSRERVRQIENKVKKRFQRSLNKKKIILKIYASRNQDDVLTPEELQEYFGDRTNEVLFLLRSCESTTYVYNKDLDVFIVENEGLSERTAVFIENLPDSFGEDMLYSLMETGIEQYDLGKEIIETAIAKEYNKTGENYHRAKIKLSSVYERVLKKYYPNGIRVYDEEEITKFRSCVKEEYENVQLPQNNRALAARIINASILCDRGKYKVKGKQYLSKELERNIYKFIDNSDSTVFMITSIYEAFEEELLLEGVDNKYYLHGILRELYGKKWVFRKDYLSKDESVTSVSAEIVNYIKDSQYPVDVSQIQYAFPGITNTVIKMVINNRNILKLFGKYIHASKINLSVEDIDYLHKKIDSELRETGICNSKLIYEYTKEERPSILQKNYIDYPFALYSLLEYKFASQYAFSRPFIARRNTEIGTVTNVLREVITGSDEIEITDIREFSRDHHLTITNLLELINSCNETHLLADDHRVISIELSGLNQHLAIIIEGMIYNELKDGETVPISNLKCIVDFPSIDLKWSEWLIYSAMKKWSTRLDVGASSNQFRHAIPLIAKKGELDEMAFSGVAKESIGEMVTPDDLSNIDDLLMDFIEDDWGD